MTPMQYDLSNPMMGMWVLNADTPLAMAENDIEKFLKYYHPRQYAKMNAGQRVGVLTPTSESLYSLGFKTGSEKVHFIKEPIDAGLRDIFENLLRSDVRKKMQMASPKEGTVTRSRMRPRRPTAEMSVSRPATAAPIQKPVTAKPVEQPAPTTAVVHPLSQKIETPVMPTQKMATPTGTERKTATGIKISMPQQVDTQVEERKKVRKQMREVHGLLMNHETEILRLKKLLKPNTMMDSKSLSYLQEALESSETLLRVARRYMQNDKPTQKAKSETRVIAKPEIISEWENQRKAMMAEENKKMIVYKF